MARTGLECASERKRIKITWSLEGDGSILASVLSETGKLVDILSRGMTSSEFLF